jgi:hypothetical protein
MLNVRDVQMISEMEEEQVEVALIVGTVAPDPPSSTAIEMRGILECGIAKILVETAAEAHVTIEMIEGEIEEIDIEDIVAVEVEVEIATVAVKLSEKEDKLKKSAKLR